jgi:hypothetical protein
MPVPLEQGQLHDRVPALRACSSEDPAILVRHGEDPDIDSNQRCT